MALTETLAFSNVAAAGPHAPALYANGRFFLSYVEDGGACKVSLLRGTTWDTVEVRSYSGVSGEGDIHNNASLAVDSKGYIWAFTQNHGDTTTRGRLLRSGNPYDINFFRVAGAVDLTPLGARYVSILIDSSDVIWLFYNYEGSGTTRHIGFNKSTDGGATWSGNTQLYQSGTDERAYFVATLIDDNPHLLNTPDIPLGSNAEDVFLIRWDGTNWVNTGGTTYTLPVTSATGDVVFDASSAGASGDFNNMLSKDASGDYFLVLTSWVGGARDAFWYCKYSGGSWSQTKILTSLTPRDSVIPKPGGTYDFLSIEDDGVDYPVIRISSSDSGATWSSSEETTGGLTRERGLIKPILGISPADFVDDAFYAIWQDLTRINNATWTSDIYAPFSAASAVTAGTHQATITLDATKIPSSPTNFILRVDLNDLPAAVKSAVSAGGTNIECFKSDDTTQLPVDVRRYNTSAGTGEMFVLLSGSTSDSVDTDIHFYTGNTVGHIHDDTYGSQAVYADYARVWPLNGAYGFDATGKGNLSFTNSPASRTGPLTGRSALDLDGSTQYATAADANDLSLLVSGTPWTVSFFLIQDAVNSSADGFGNFVLHKNTEYAIQLDEQVSGTTAPSGLRVATFGSNNRADITEDVSLGSWVYCVATGLAGTRYGTSVAGATLSSPGATDVSSNFTDDLYVGTNITQNVDEFLDGGLAELRISNTHERDDDWITIEKNNYDGTLYLISAAGGTTIDADSGSFSLTGGEVLLTVQRQLSGNPGTFSLTGSDATLTYAPVASFQLDADPGTFTFTGGEVLLTVQRALSADAGSYTLTGSDATLSYGRVFTADAGSFSFTGSDVSFSRGYAMSLEPGEFTLTGSTVNFSYSGEARVHTINGILITGA